MSDPASPITVTQSGSITANVDGAGRISGASGSAISLNASGGTAPFTWQIVAGTLPPGLTLDSSGSIRPFPQARGSALIRVRCIDSATPPNFADADLTITVS